MKSTVIKASLNLANEIANDLLSRKDQRKPDRSLFTRRDLDKGGFEVYGIEQPEKKETVVFRFTTSPAARIDYDDRLITIK